MITKLKERLEQENFYPGWIGFFTNPFYFARKGLLQNIRTISHNIQGVTLDIGCGNKPYRKIFSHATPYIGLEIASAMQTTKQVDCFYDGHTLPFADASFDSIVTNQVFEHVFNPERFLRESHRVLKEDGHLLMTVPFVWDEHEQPFDYARYSSYGLKHLLERNGYEVIAQVKSIDDIRVIFQLINAYIVKTCYTRNPYLNLLLCLLFISLFNLIGSIAAFIFPRNEDLYLDNIVLAKKMTT